MMSQLFSSAWQAGAGVADTAVDFEVIIARELMGHASWGAVLNWDGCVGRALSLTQARQACSGTITDPTDGAS